MARTPSMRALLGARPKMDDESRRSLRALRGWLQAWWHRRVPFAISLGLTAFALFIYSYTFIGDRPTAVFSFINRLELNALDLRFRIRPERYKHPDPRIIIVDIDQRTQEILGRWPFTRTHFAKMLDALREDGAKVAAFDITFSKPDETAAPIRERSEEHTSELQSHSDLVCRLLLEKKKTTQHSESVANRRRGQRALPAVRRTGADR